MITRQLPTASARPDAATVQALRIQALRLLLPLAAVAALPLLSSTPATASMMDQIILGECSKAMQADFKKAGKTPPAGMVDSTCSCVVAQMKKRQSIDQAKTTCTNQALQQYGKI